MSEHKANEEKKRPDTTLKSFNGRAVYPYELIFGILTVISLSEIHKCWWLIGLFVLGHQYKYPAADAGKFQ